MSCTALCANVVAHPEESSFRSIRLLNGHFQQSVARHSGGVEVLMAIGFVEKDGVDEEGLCELSPRGPFTW